MKSKNFVFVATFGLGQVLVPYFEMKRLGYCAPDYHPVHQHPVQINSAICTYGQIDYYKNLSGGHSSATEGIQLATLANR